MGDAGMRRLSYVAADAMIARGGAASRSAPPCRPQRLDGLRVVPPVGRRVPRQGAGRLEDARTFGLPEGRR